MEEYTSFNKEMALDYEKEFTCGKTTITRGDYEGLPLPMKTLSLSDNDMSKLAESIEHQMKSYQDWVKDGVMSEEDYQDRWWGVMEDCGLKFGMTYYDEEV